MPRSVVPALAALALTLTACGGSDASDAEAVTTVTVMPITPTAATSPAGTTLTVTEPVEPALLTMAQACAEIGDVVAAVSPPMGTAWDLAMSDARDVLARSDSPTVAALTPVVAKLEAAKIEPGDVDAFTAGLRNATRAVRDLNQTCGFG